MEIENKYLTFAEYKQLGGQLPEASFKLLEFKAENIIDHYTQGRLKNLVEQNNDVKMCVFELIGLEKSQESYAETSGNIVSESIDGYSVTYLQANTDTIKSQNAQLKNVVKQYLSDCKLDDGTPYLYVGVDKNVKKCGYYILP